MADLFSIERRKLERLFRMGGGYMLDFSARTFSEFFEEHTRRDIDTAVYREGRTVHGVSDLPTCRAATVPIERVVTPTTAATQT